MSSSSDAALQGRDAVVKIIEELAKDFEEDGSDWSHSTIEGYLGALAALLESTENVYKFRGRPVPEDPWVIMAEAFRGSKTYE